MNSKLLLIFTLSLIVSTFAKRKNDSIEGEWTSLSKNNKPIDNGHMVITKDSIVTYFNNNEDSRVAYTKNRNTIIIDGNERTINIYKDTLTVQNDNQTIKYLRFDFEKLPKSSQEMLKSINGEWHVIGFISKENFQPTPKDEIMRLTINSSYVDIFVNNKRIQSNNFTIKDDHLQIENDKIFPKIYGDTLKLTTDSESLILLPLNMVTSINTENKTPKDSSMNTGNKIPTSSAAEHCKEAVTYLKTILNAATTYWAENGEYPSSLDKLLTPYGFEIPEGIWSYSYSIKEHSAIVRATLKDASQIGKIESGNFIEFNSKGDQIFSHDDFKKYLNIQSN